MTLFDLEIALATYLKDAEDNPGRPDYVMTGMGIPIMSSNWYQYCFT